MRLKNILIIVDKLEESVRFYKDLFGLQVILKQEGNVKLSEGLVLQDVNVWYESTQIPTTSHSNITELYFEENDMECFIKKLESYDFCLNYVNKLTKLEGGQKLVRFYDPSGNLIEVRTPVNYN
jgi:catechol 2,3-dioxygenase-like lactoylglutathione lyase family enzyme